MIWICTLCLLFLAAWLFFNALNERRWVEAHSHDENVANDPGFLPSFSTLTGTGSYGPDGKVSIDQEDTRFARAVKKVKDTTSKYSEKLEAKAAAAKFDNPEDRPGSAGEENTLFGRSVARVRQTGRQLDEKAKSAANFGKRIASDVTADEGLVDRTSRRVAAKSEEVSKMVANRAKNISQGFSDGRAGSADGSMFGKMAGKVSGGGRNARSGIDAKMADAKNPDTKNGDIVSRLSAKVGNKVNELDDKLVTASRGVSDKVDDKFVAASKATVDKLDKS